MKIIIENTCCNPELVINTLITKLIENKFSVSLTIRGKTPELTAKRMFSSRIRLSSRNNRLEFDIEKENIMTRSVKNLFLNLANPILVDPCPPLPPCISYSSLELVEIENIIRTALSEPETACRFCHEEISQGGKSWE